jgi:UDP-2-acetamido-3-amino-2,3-dideoxy-glucuronate N-acetyltransferase
VSYTAGPLQKIRDVEIGEDVLIDDFVNLYECRIGAGTKIAVFVEVGKGVRIGERCNIACHAYICPGVTIEDEVFIGERVNFINDMYPRATNPSGNLATASDWSLRPTLVKRGARIGARAVIMCDVTVGEYAVIQPGSVVTKDVPPGAVVSGNPAQVILRSNTDGPFKQ